MSSMNTVPVNGGREKAVLTSMPAVSPITYKPNSQTAPVAVLINGDASVLRALYEIAMRNPQNPNTPSAQFSAGIINLVEGREELARANLKSVVESSRATNLGAMAGFYLEYIKPAYDS